MAENRTPAVISGPELANILTRVSEKLTESDDFFIQLKHNAQAPYTAPPSLAIIIQFDPEKLTAKTVTFTTEKKAAKEWGKKFVL